MALMAFGIKSVLTVAEWLTGWPGAVRACILPLACLSGKYGGFAGRARRATDYLCLWGRAGGDV